MCWIRSAGLVAVAAQHALDLLYQPVGSLQAHEVAYVRERSPLHFRATLLDGANDHVVVPHNASLNLGDGPLTLEAWIKRGNANTGEMNMFQKGASAYQFHFWNNEVNGAKDNVASFVKSSPTVTDTSWHHQVVTKSGSARKLYIDGVDRTSLLTDQTLIDTTSALFLGAKNGTSGFLGATIDEFAVYNQVLSLATVLDHYKAGTGTG